MHVGVTARKATADDAGRLAELRWRWAAEERDYAGADHDAFVAAFTAWVVEHRPSHLPFLAEVDGAAVGMATLLVAERVPSPARRCRLFGDVQSVYVTPEMRDGGVGAVLLAALLEEARTLGLEHVTVHSSDRAVRFYQRAGFGQDERWLRWQPE